MVSTRQTFKSLLINIVIFLILFILFNIFKSPRISYAETEVYDDIDSDTTWTYVDSPYIIKSDIWVDRDATLTIESNVIVKFDYNMNLVINGGTLSAIGTSDKKIVFTSIYDYYDGDDSDYVVVDYDPWRDSPCVIDIDAITSATIVSSTTTTASDLTTTTATESTTTTVVGQPCLLVKILGEYSEELELLRYLRDNVLSQTPEGKEIIKTYYEWSPVIVKAMDEDEGFKEEVKEVIDGVLLMIREEIQRKQVRGEEK